MKATYPALYSAFDPYPSPKGSGTHIRHFSATLFEQYGGDLLYSLGPADEPSTQTKGGISYERFNQPIRNYLQRAEAFTKKLRSIVATQSDLKMMHFRDIWSGLPLLEMQRNYATLFDVNGLPSIELPYRYGKLPVSPCQKIYQLEQDCLQQVDHIVVPSSATRSYLKKRLIPEEKITLIPNGADVPSATPRPKDAPETYLIYFDALQPW